MKEKKSKIGILKSPTSLVREWVSGQLALASCTCFVFNVLGVIHFSIWPAFQAIWFVGLSIHLFRTLLNHELDFATTAFNVCGGTRACFDRYIEAVSYSIQVEHVELYFWPHWRGLFILKILTLMPLKIAYLFFCLKKMIFPWLSSSYKRRWELAPLYTLVYV